MTFSEPSVHLISQYIILSLLTYSNIIICYTRYYINMSLTSVGSLNLTVAMSDHIISLGQPLARDT